MSREDKLELEGTVVKNHPGSKFEVKLDQNDMIIQCTLSGKLRMNSIRILLGDRVTVELSPYDLTKGIITWRKK